MDNTELILSRRDLDFLLYEWLDVTALTVQLIPEVKAALAVFADAGLFSGQLGGMQPRDAAGTGDRPDRQVTTGLFAAGDVNVALANSSVYLEAVGHAVVAWMWLEQLLAAEGKAGDFYDGERAAVRYFFRWELPKVDVQLGRLASLHTTALDMQNAWF